MEDFLVMKKDYKKKHFQKLLVKYFQKILKKNFIWNFYMLKIRNLKSRMIGKTEPEIVY